MTADKNHYSVIDLAAVLQVPRTTVNDWLKKFDRYIDFEMRGRRKVYTDESLEVLRLISSARDKGMPLQDLEQELSLRCAVRPEISPLAEDLETEADNAQTSHSSEGENLPAVNFDFSGFLKEIEKRETHRNRSGKRSFALICLLLVLLLGVCCATLLLLGQLLTLKESSKTLSAQLAAAKEESGLLRRSTEKEFKIIADRVAKSELSGTRAAEKLQNRLNDQRKQFERLLAKLEKAEKIREKELENLEKENFRFKAELTSAVRLLTKKQKQLETAEKTIQTLEKANSRLKDQISRLKKEKTKAAAVKVIQKPAQTKKEEKTR